MRPVCIYLPMAFATGFAFLPMETRPLTSDGRPQDRGLRLDTDEQGRASAETSDAAGELFSNEFGSPTRDLPEKFVSFFEKDMLRIQNPSANPIDPANLHFGYSGWRNNIDVTSWNKTRGDKKLGLGSSNLKDVKAVIGIMSYTAHREIRDAHRMTWMTHKGVCSIDNWEKEDCHVFPLFVFGDVVEPIAIEGENDILILSDVPEPGDVTDGYHNGSLQHNNGKLHDKTQDMWESSQLKTPAFFRHASKNFRWASHIGKMDLDTYPSIPLLQDAWSRASTASYMGVLFNGGFAGKGGMYGAMYGITSDLLDCWLKSEQAHHAVFKKDERAGRNPWLTHAEDQIFSYLLFASHDGPCASYRLVDLTKHTYYEHPVR